MSLLSARSLAEAYLYMELSACPRCGSTFQVPDSSVVMVEGDLAGRYAGPCPGCGTEREFVFRLPDEEPFPDEDEPSFGGDQPSDLVDAGQWLWVADQIGQSVPAEPAGMTPDERRQAEFDLRTAAAAVSEAAKFIPPGRDDLPPDAVWSARGREVLQAEPGRFRRARLLLAERTYREFAEGFAGSASVPLPGVGSGPAA